MKLKEHLKKVFYINYRKYQEVIERVKKAAMHKQAEMMSRERRRVSS